VDDRDWLAHCFEENRRPPEPVVGGGDAGDPEPQALQADRVDLAILDA
jgi:hypothetical protein